MTFPLFHLAKSLDRRAQKRRSLRKLVDLQTDPHLARDIGVPYRPRPPVRVDRW